MKHFLSFIFILITLQFATAQQSTHYIRLNQIGFLPMAQKQAAIINSNANTFQILDEYKKIVYTGDLTIAKNWTSSGELVQIADFSTFTLPGYYTLNIPNYGESFMFEISKSALYNVNNAILKAFYLNRASIKIDEKYAGIYARPLGHADTISILLPSAADGNRKAGDTISTPKGWYDAGDYNKYIVNSGVTVGTLLLAYENYSNYFDTLNTNIPESNNNIPDILDEARWNIEWMLSMQDKTDGGVYTKNTSAHFCGMIMPDQDLSVRYIAAKSTAATLDFAAVMAMSYRIYKKFDADFANNCLQAAQQAWEWAQIHNNIPFYNPDAEGDFPKITTGGYGDRYFNDEKTWAAAELLIATNNKKYAKYIDLDMNFSPPFWNSVGSMGLYSLNNNKSIVKTHINTNKVSDIILNMAQKLLDYQMLENPYNVSINHFAWGSNGDIANQGMLFLIAYKITGKINYYNAALSNYDYILGRNATEYSFITEYGDKCTRNVHHRPSEGDKIAGSVPGFVAGGPNGGHKRDCFGAYSQFAAKAYYDGTCSYTTNEIAINWQAPVTYLAHGIVSEYIDWQKDLQKTYVRAHSNSVTLKQGQTKATVSILSDKEWSISTQDKWYTTVTNSNKGNAIVTIEITEQNEGDSARIGSFNIISNGKILDKVEVIQKGKYKNFRLEAEDYFFADGVQKENTSDKGGGLNVGWINNGDYMKYTVDIAESGTYKLEYRVACYRTSGSIELENEEGNILSKIAISPTGGWQEWETVEGAAYFSKGKQTLLLKVPQGGFNINYIDFSYVKK